MRAVHVTVARGADSQSRCLLDCNVRTGAVPDCRDELCSNPSCPSNFPALAPDLDSDLVPTGIGSGCDVCPTVYDPLQADSDGDGLGNECDPCTDPDGDGFHTRSIPNPFPNASPVDNCPGVTNADQRDLDGDFRGDACDPIDGALRITRARASGRPRRRRAARERAARSRCAGACARRGEDAFDAAGGLAVNVRDARRLDVTVTFAPGECRTRRSGVVRCRARVGGSLIARLRPLQTRGGRELAFDLRLRGLAIERAFAAPLVVTLTDRPGQRTRGTDRVGIVETCTFTGGVPCGTGYGSARSAFLANPGASLVDP